MKQTNILLGLIVLLLCLVVWQTRFSFIYGTPSLIWRVTNITGAGCVADVTDPIHCKLGKNE